jgi:hypothetical protein
MYSFDVSGAYGFAIKMEASSHALRFNNQWEGSGSDVMTLNANGNAVIAGNLNCANINCNSSYVLGTEVYARNSYDTKIRSDSGG